MFNIFTKFKDFPKNAKKAVLFMIVGWLWFYVTIYEFILKEIPYQVIILGIIISFIAIQGYRWARPLSLTFNAGIIIFNLFIIISFFNSWSFLPLFAVFLDIILFAASTCFMLKRQTAEFFKKG